MKTSNVIAFIIGLIFMLMIVLSKYYIDYLRYDKTLKAKVVLTQDGLDISDIKNLLEE